MKIKVIILMMLLMVSEGICADKDAGRIRLTAEEETWLKNHKTVRVGMSPVLPPLKFYEKDVIKGAEPDYLHLISELAGIRFEYVICPFSEMDSKVKSGEMDMFISFHIPERLTYVMFTEPLMDHKQVIITRNDAPFISGIRALRGKKVAVAKGVRLYKKMLAPYPDIGTVEVSDIEEMFKAVSELKADALILRTLYAGYSMQKYPNLKIAGIADHPPEPYLYAVRKDYPELVSILNKAIASITKEQHDAIFQKWCSVNIEYRPNWSEMLKWAFAIGSFFIIILGITLLWNRRLTKEIVERKKAEDSLKESEQQFRAMFENHHAVMLLIDIESGRIIRANKGAEKYYGYTAKEFENLTIQQINQLTEEEIASEMADAYIEKRNYFHFPHRLASGELRDVEVHSSPIPFKGKSILFSVIHDITDRKRAEIAMREQKERLNAILNATIANICVVDRQFNLVEYNKAFASIFDLTRDDLGKNILELFSEEVRKKLKDWIERIFFTGIPKRTESQRGSLWVDAILYPVYDDAGNITEVAIYAMDITERRQLEEKRIELERQVLNVQKMESLGRISAGIAHNFNNILYVVTGNIEMAMDDIPPESPTRRTLEQAFKAANRAADLTRKILAYSGSGYFKFREVDVSRLIEDNINVFKSVISQTVSFSLNLTENIPLINADSEQIQRVITNILVNACEAVGENAGTVILSTGITDDYDPSLNDGFRRIDDPERKSVSGRCVYIEISDTGCGMNEEEVKLLTDPFFTTKFMGRGLGMSEVHGIISTHKGAILVKSELGQGTTIRVLFPVSESVSSDSKSLP